MRISLKPLTFPLAMALACGVGQSVLAQDVEVDAPGTTIRVGPDRGEGGESARADVRVRAPGVRVNVDGQRGIPAADAEPLFWVGILGGDLSPELRAHINAPIEVEGQGVIVRSVLPNSPAAEAGLQQHDILLFANGEPITGMGVLAEEVKKVGPSGGQVTVELLRAGKQETVWVKPAERPAPVAQPGFREQPVEPGGMLGRIFGGEGGPLRLRIFGGDGAIAGAGNVQINANGMSVSVKSVNGKTRVNVKQLGEDGAVAKEWDVDASDPKALEQLPPDVRAMVDGVMSMGANVDINVNEMIPDLGGLLERRGGLFRARDRRLEEMQRQIEELQRRVLGEVPPPAPAGDPAAAGGGEAPAFDPDAAPAEVEIPAEEK